MFLLRSILSYAKFTFTKIRDLKSTVNRERGNFKSEFHLVSDDPCSESWVEIPMFNLKRFGFYFGS